MVNFNVYFNEMWPKSNLWRNLNEFYLFIDYCIKMQTENDYLHSAFNIYIHIYILCYVVSLWLNAV